MKVKILILDMQWYGQFYLYSLDKVSVKKDNLDLWKWLKWECWGDRIAGTSWKRRKEWRRHNEKFGSSVNKSEI